MTTGHLFGETAMKSCMMITLGFVFATLGQAAEYTVEVKAGKSHRKDTPVSIELVVPEGLKATVGVATCGSETVPVQVVKFGTATARAWWIVSDLPAGKSKTYKIKMGKGAGPKSADVFAWKDSSKGKVKSMDLMLGKRPVLRYMHTPFDKNDIETTKKPFHHAFAPDGSRTITQGLNGKPYPHHRGLYFGYNKCKIPGLTYNVDTWHAHKGEHQIHKKVIREITGPVVGGHVLKIHWCDRRAQPFAEETRTLLAYRQSNGNLLIEFATSLKSLRGDVKLDGDPQHAGVQFRAYKDVATNEKETRYLRPAKWADLDTDKQYNPGKNNEPTRQKDLPWNALQFSLDGQGFTVAYLTSPKNPDNALFSERLYGRFGEFFKWDLRRDNPLAARYRWWISDTRSTNREQVEGRYQDLACPAEVVLK